MNEDVRFSWEIVKSFCRKQEVLEADMEGIKRRFVLAENDSHTIAPRSLHFVLGETWLARAFRREYADQIGRAGTNQEKVADLVAEKEALKMYTRSVRSVIEALAEVRNTPRGSRQYIKPGTYLSGDEIKQVFDRLASQHHVVFEQRRLGSAVTVQLIADALERVLNRKSA